MSLASNVALILMLLVAIIYCYSLHYTTTHKLKDIPDYLRHVVPKSLDRYGIFKFLTVQCFMIQIISTLLHIGAHFLGSLVKARDLVFTILAYPIGLHVTLFFWGYWFILGREYILPKEVDQFFPIWMNHITHTMMLPVNLALTLLVDHKYYPNGLTCSLAYMTIYMIFVRYVKYQTGDVIYIFVKYMNELELVLYFLFSLVAHYLIYKSGEYITRYVHKQNGPRKQQTAIEKEGRADQPIPMS